MLKTVLDYRESVLEHIISPAMNFPLEKIIYSNGPSVWWGRKFGNRNQYGKIPYYLASAQRIGKGIADRVVQRKVLSKE